MQRIVVTYTSANSGAIVPLGYDNVSVGIAFACEVTGTVNYTVNFTLDNIYDPNVTPVWFPCGLSNVIAASTSQVGNFVLPVAAMQVVINSGAGSVKLVVLQEGII